MFCESQIIYIFISRFEYFEGDELLNVFPFAHAHPMCSYLVAVVRAFVPQ